MRKQTLNIVFSGLLGIFLLSCGSKETKDENQNGSESLLGNITIDGSSTVYPITEAVAEEFMKVASQVRVTAGLSGTGGGFKKFARAEMDINDASRPIKASEDSVCASNNVKYIELKVGYDGLAVVVSPENTWCNDITVEELKMMWEPAAQGKIKTWNQIRKDWPNQEIHLFGPGVESGTYDYFTEVIVGKSHSSRGDYTASEDDNVLVQGIKSDKNAIGFFGLAYYTENSSILKLVGVNSGNGAVLPSEETVKNKTYSPLGRPLFIYVNDKAAARKEVQVFVDFYLENTKTLTAEVGYVPLSDTEVADERAKFSSFIKNISPAN
ncbi:PstS family phosphate ABC transporter substrate-binding protein [Aurantibacillus circumpalustris]|uniref:PstS family phosphate ABC transporter substrate-binding protein n=1 Tax=Aurantibacillus circumpalustris TaxID=3036359 RepID=UPI00295B741B|nr:PstS family phosphate ABC transporter substrate-binding protein [Aurantibacillus circumpalustris]